MQPLDLRADALVQRMIGMAGFARITRWSLRFLPCALLFFPLHDRACLRQDGLTTWGVGESFALLAQGFSIIVF